MERLRADAQHWNNLNNIPGQTIAFQKTKWQILAWELLKGNLQIKNTTERTLVLKDNKGGVAVIEFQTKAWATDSAQMATKAPTSTRFMIL